MSKYSYSFIQFPNGIYRPFIPIGIINPIDHIGIRMMALIDTGADACLFPKMVPDITKHTLKADGVLSNITKGVGVNRMTTWKHTFIIRLYDSDQKTIIWESEKDLIDCADHSDIPVILGTNGFLFNFKICLDYPKKNIIIEM